MEIGALPVRAVHLERTRIVWYKRYFGPYEASLDSWPKFRAELERLGIENSGQCHGLVVDSAITAPEKIRYGCAIDPVLGMDLPACWSVFETQSTRSVVFTIRSTYRVLGAVMPRVIAAGLPSGMLRHFRPVSMVRRFALH